MINNNPTEACVFAQRRRDDIKRLVEKLLETSHVDQEEDLSSSSSEDAEDASECKANEIVESSCGRRRSSSRQRLSNEDLPLCRVTTRRRAGCGREDLTIITPDGRAFRSRLAAFNHLQRTGVKRQRGRDTESDRNEESE